MGGARAGETQRGGRQGAGVLSHDAQAPLQCFTSCGIRFAQTTASSLSDGPSVHRPPYPSAMDEQVACSWSAAPRSFSLSVSSNPVAMGPCRCTAACSCTRSHDADTSQHSSRSSASRDLHALSAQRCPCTCRASASRVCGHGPCARQCHAPVCTAGFSVIE
jgi:hypothetical protein